MCCAEELYKYKQNMVPKESVQPGKQVKYETAAERRTLFAKWKQ